MFSIFAASPVITLTLDEKKEPRFRTRCTRKGEGRRGGEAGALCIRRKGSSVLLWFPQPWIQLCFVLQKHEACWANVGIKAKIQLWSQLLQCLNLSHLLLFYPSTAGDPASYPGTRAPCTAARQGQDSHHQLPTRPHALRGSPGLQSDAALHLWSQHSVFSKADFLQGLGQLLLFILKYR